MDNLEVPQREARAHRSASPYDRNPMPATDATQNDIPGQKKLLLDKIRNRKLSRQLKNRNKHQPQPRLAFQVDKYEIDLECVIGKGAFGQVYKAHLIDRPEEVFACKLISQNRLDKQEIYEEDKSKSMIMRLEAEVEAHKGLSDCKYVVKLYDSIKVENAGYYFFMELCDIDLGRFIAERGCLPESEALDLFRQLLKGYKYLYDRGVSHRDLKPQNLLLQGKNLKISDFGYLILKTAQRNVLAQSLVGTINYLAPDIIIAERDKTKYNPFKSDVWSMGVILFKMLYGREPYQSHQTQQLLQIIKDQPLVFPEQPHISNKTRQIIQKMIEKDPETRINFPKLYQHFIGEEQQGKQEGKSPVSSIYSQKERLLVFYNLVMNRISYDSSYHATLREIGIGEYQKFTAKVMTYTHEKRMNLVRAGQPIHPDIKKEIMQYHQIFYEAVKENAQLNEPEENLLVLLSNFRHKLRQYEQFDMLHQQVQYFLLLVLLYYNLEKGFVSTDYIYTIIDKEKNNRMSLKKLEELKKKNLDYQ